MPDEKRTTETERDLDHTIQRIAETTRSLVHERVQIAKRAPVQSESPPVTNVLPTQEDVSTIFTNAGALPPPYDPETLVVLYEHSNALRPNVDAYVTNVESFGHRLEPLIDLDAQNSADVIGDAMFLSRLHDCGSDPTAQASYPTPEEIESKRTEIRHAMRLEKAKLSAFFERCADSWIELRKRRRVDYEVTGNAFWEVRRNGRGEIAKLEHVPSHSVRLLPLEPEEVEVREVERVSATSVENTTTRRRFRRFVQIVYNRLVFFREFGDPRPMNSRTGTRYNTIEEMQASDPKAVPATEIAHFALYSGRSPYGIPRWVGNMLAVLGSRAAEEVNYFYFDNKAIPPLAVLVSGGRLAPDVTKKIESYVSEQIRGRNNFHKILIVEAESGDTSGRPGASAGTTGKVSITIEKLADQQNKDALFQTYDERNIDKVGTSFRLPRLLRGDVRDFNRATAEAALEFCETQVFQPERGSFDEWVCTKILQPSGIRYWRFVSNSPVARDPETIAKMVKDLSEAGVLTPEDGRQIAEDIFNREFKAIEGAWTKLPLSLTTAGYVEAPTLNGEESTAPAPVEGEKPAAPDEKRLAAVASMLAALRGRLTGAETSARKAEQSRARKAFDEGEEVTLEISREEMSKLVERDPV